LLALLAEQAEKCPQCGHQMSECRDFKLAYEWEVVEDKCWPGALADAIQANNAKAEKPTRGLVLGTRRKGR
jgi:hypothetical protein